MEQMLQKQTNFNLKMDELGRIHIPIQIRNELNIQEREKLYIYRYNFSHPFFHQKKKKN